jgi:hypothetical protein
VFTQRQAAPAATVSVVLLAGLYPWGLLVAGGIRPGHGPPGTLRRSSLDCPRSCGSSIGIGGYDDVPFRDHTVQHLILIMVDRPGPLRCRASGTQAWPGAPPLIGPG